MFKNKRYIVFLLCLMVFLSISIATASAAVTLSIDADKTQYAPGDEVNLILKFTGVVSELTNSLQIDLNYDDSAFALQTGTPNNDITSGYINFGVKQDLGSTGLKYLRMLYIDMNSDTSLQNNVVVATIKMKALTTASSGIKTFSIKPLTFMDSNFNAYTPTLVSKIIAIADIQSTGQPTVTGNVKAGDASISGTAEAGATITVKREGISIGTATADTQGEFTINLTAAIAANDQLAVTAAVSGKTESSAFILTVASSQQITVTLVDSLGTSHVGYGTSQGQLEGVYLPYTMEVGLSNSTQETVSIEWDGGNPPYDDSIAGNYVFTGTLTDLWEGVTNPSNLKTSKTIIVDSLEACTPVISAGE